MKMLAIALIAGFVTSTTAAAAQQPKISNAQASVREHGSLAQEIAAAKGPEWIGYTVATVRALHMGSWGDDKEYLEGRPTDYVQAERKEGEPQARAVVLLRVADGKVTKVQLSDVTRELDGGGLPFVWMSDVRPADSLAVLQAAVDATADSTQRVENGLLAISVHDMPQATTILRGFTAAKYPLKVREKAAFWLANERGQAGLDAVTALLKSADEDAFREQLVFDLTLVRDPSRKAAVDELLSVAKTDASAKVRSKAQFWLAQVVSRKGDDDGRVAKALNDSARNDPDAAMRKSAVFALSRLPQEQAAQQLIQVASSTKDPSTRREAIFWLGQSKDPKALAYLEQVVRE